jgi:hypothetical protein
MSDGVSGGSEAQRRSAKFNNCPILQSDPDGLSAKVSIVVVDK